MKKLILILILLYIPLYAQLLPEQITTEMIKTRINELTTSIIETQNPDGSWTYNNYNIGATAIHLLALATAGLSEKEPAIQKGIAYLKQNFPISDTYSISLYATAFQAIDQRKYKDEIKKAAEWLIAHQQKGTWNYAGDGPGDHSITQFAILGLKAAVDAGIEVPQEVFTYTANHLKSAQNQDGGWPYSGMSSSTPSMTAAALASLSICDVEKESSEEIKKGPSFCGVYKNTPSISAGISWLNQYMNKNGPSAIFTEAYTAYALERVGIFFDQKFIGKYDWYREGSAHFINNDINLGHYTPKAFKLLFLAKGDTPVLFNKIKWGESADWNRRHNDTLHNVKTLSKLFEEKLDWQISGLDLEDKRLGQAPILYISGLKEFNLGVEEKQALKSYVESGGTILFSPCLKSEIFASSVLKVLKEIFPGSHFENVPKSHELRRMFYDLQNIHLPLKVFMNNCTYKRIFISTQDLSLEYEKKVPSKLSQYTMANLTRFALKDKPLVGKLDNVKITQAKVKINKTPLYKTTENTSSSGIDITQILYGEEPAKINPDSMNNQLGFMRKELQTPTAAGISLLSLKEKNPLKNKAILYMTGNKGFELSKEEIINLSEYIKNGGFLFADSKCSCEEFNQSFSNLLKEIFPQSKLELIPIENPVYQIPFKHSIEFTKTLKKETDEAEPFLLGIRHENRYVVIYSPLDFSSALSNKIDESAKGIKSPAAFKIVTNIITYGLSY